MENLESVVTNSRVLKSFDRINELFVVRDAAEYAIGAVIQQKTNQNDVRLLPPPELLKSVYHRYPAHEHELLAIVDTLRTWRNYLYGRQCTDLTDH